MARMQNDGGSVSVDRMLPIVREVLNYKGGRTSLWRIMKAAMKTSHFKSSKLTKLKPGEWFLNTNLWSLNFYIKVIVSKHQ